MQWGATIPQGDDAAEEPVPARAPAPTAFEDGLLLEDFVRLPESLEIEVSRAYWDHRGLRSFIHREVPSDITNNGIRAHQSARVLYANCEEAERSGLLDDEINVVEFGMGLGLFARLFLRRFRQLCRDGQRNYFDRLRYFATDCSARNLAEVERCGTLQEFADVVRPGLLDARHPSCFQPADGGPTECLTGRMRAILHNYLYDALPHSQLLRQDGCWYELHLQTRLFEPWRVDGFDRAAPGEFLGRIRDRDADTIAALARCYEWIGVERSFLPTSADRVPEFDVARRFADEVLQPFVDASPSGSRNVRFWLPWGALACHRESIPLLGEGGFMLFCDYGVADVAQLLEARSYQRYGAGVCIGLNFPLLDRVLADPDHTHGLQLTTPEGDASLPLHARLLARPEDDGTREAFRQSFSSSAFAHIDEPVVKARELLDRGEPREAFANFAEALRRCDQNWRVAAEWAYSANKAGEPVTAVLDVVRRGLDMNPTCSADLWNELGDTYLRDRRNKAAEDAFRRAARIDPAHARSHYNLARVYAAQEDYQAALRSIGESLSHDEDGSHTELLLQKQAELLDAQRHACDIRRRRVDGRYL